MPEKNYSGLEERTAKVEGLLEQMDKRLDRVEVGIIDLKNEIKSDMGRLEAILRAEISNLRADMGKIETGLRADMEKIETGLRADMEKIETGLRADMEKLEARLRADMEKLEANLKSEFSKLDGRFMWLIGIIIGTWVTAILTIIFKG